MLKPFTNNKIIRTGLFLYTSICIFSLAGKAQVIEQDSIPQSINKKRLTTVVVGGSVLYSATMIGLNQLWYSEYDQSSFHFFNDNKEWLQMDKFGHTVTAYHFSKAAKK